MLECPARNVRWSSPLLIPLARIKKQFVKKYRPYRIIYVLTSRWSSAATPHSSNRVRCGVKARGILWENTLFRESHIKFGESRCSSSSSTKRYSSSHKRDRIASRYSRCRPTAAAHPPLPTVRACRCRPEHAARSHFPLTCRMPGESDGF